MGSRVPQHLPHNAMHMEIAAHWPGLKAVPGMAHCRQRCRELELALDSRQSSGSDQDTAELVDVDAGGARPLSNGTSSRDQVASLEADLKVTASRLTAKCLKTGRT